MNLGKISVGPPYFDTVFVPLLTPLVFLMGVGPLARWKEAALPDLAARLKWAAGARRRRDAAGRLDQGRRRHRRRGRPADGVLDPRARSRPIWSSACARPAACAPASLQRARQIPRAMVGMMIAHVGVAVFILGVTLVQAPARSSATCRWRIGDTTTIDGMVFTFRGASDVRGPNYRAAQGEIEVTRDGTHDRHAAPREALLSGLAVDPDRSGDRQRLHARPLRLARRAGRRRRWIVRVYVKPFVDWIWGGCLIMALGGLLAATDRRYRARARQRAARRPTRAATA